MLQNYVIYGRLIAHLETTYPQGHGKRLSIIRASLISWVFVLSDVFTLLVSRFKPVEVYTNHSDQVQMAGGGMTAIKGKEIMGNNLL